MSGQVALYVWSFVLALLFSMSATQLVIRLAHRLKILDVPGGRRQHARPMPRPGGVAIFIAFGLAIAVFWTIDVLSGGPVLIPEEVRSPRFRLVVLAAVASVVVGFFDDLVDLRARWQLLGQTLVAAIVVAAGVRIEFVNNPLDPRHVFELGVLAVPLTFLWIVGMINALNFIDGLDGLAAGVSAIAAVCLGFIALTPAVNEPFVAWMEFALAGALIGFLIFNVHPAKLFLGTTGVTFVGTVLATLSIFGTAKVAAALLVLGVPIIDTFYVIIRRLIERRPPFAPDRGHFHHRLLDVGLSHTQAVFLIYVITAALGAVALLASGQAQVLAFATAFVILGVAVVVLAQRSTKAQEFEPGLYPNGEDTGQR
jgi:UDP-GlcNAc:undecaprenyl-phosphate GlcNAc-1-phosphate transferase